MTVDAERPSPRRRRPRPWLALGLLVLVGLVCGAWLGVRALQARDALNEARTSLEAARVALLDRRIPEAQRAIAEAGRSTERARSLTGDPLWRAAGLVPVAGNSLDTARGLSVAADDLARDVLPDALSAVQGLDPAKLRDRSGRVDLATLRTVAPVLGTAATRARAVQDDVEDLPDSALVSAVGDARAEVVEQLGELTRTVTAGADALEIAPTLLGGDRPRRYLVLIQQNGESRGTGGLIGGFAEVTASNGKITAVRTGSNRDLVSGKPVAVPRGVPADWAERYGDQGSLALWTNINVSPDLPVVARVVEARWRAQGGGDLDGVAMTDAQGLAALLEGSGNVRLADGRAIAPAQLPAYLAVRQYVGVVDDQLQRKEQLDVVARAAVTRLTGGGGDSLALLRGLSNAIRSGHLRMASDDPALAPVLARTGVDGGLPVGAAPVAYPVVFNATGGKLETWLGRSITYTAGSCKGSRRSSTITTALTSRPPAALPPYLTIRQIDGVRTSSTTGRVGLMVYGTRGAVLTGATLDGQPLAGDQLETGSEAGLPVWLVYLDTPPGTTRQLALQLNEPTSTGQARVPEQPLAQGLQRTIDAPTCG